MLFLKRSLKAKVTCGWKAQAVFETAMDVKKHTSLSFLEKNTQDLNHQPVFESMINSSGRDSDLSLFIVVCNQICAQARCNSTLADTFKHLIWLLEVFMPRARLRKHLVMNRWSLDSGAWIPILSKSKKCLWFLPFTPGSPSPPAICFWISLAATVSGAGNCRCYDEQFWNAPPTDSAETIVIPNQNKKPFFGRFPLPTDMWAILLGRFTINTIKGKGWHLRRFVLFILWHQAIFSLLSDSSDNIAWFVGNFWNCQTSIKPDIHLSTTIYSFSVAKIGHPWFPSQQNHTKWCPMVSTWFGLV